MTGIKILIVVALVNAVFSQSGNEKLGQNLKLTFGSPEEIPAGFFDTPSLEKREAEGRIVYSSCQDGSGGLCVGRGKCPQSLKPATQNANACKSSQECCFGLPSDEKVCKNRGGECVPKSRCGSAPTANEATDCKKGEVCCIFV